MARNNNKPTVKDQFFCLSLQRDHGPKSQSAFVQAVRSAKAALAVKAIWIDVDVGKAGAYDTIEDALGAIIAFKDTVGLPMPSAMVGSGGGIHVYWISHTAMPVAEWLVYADGLKQLLLKSDLKCDAPVTGDVARILRVPGTFNHKTNPPKPVQLFNLPLVMYDFPTQLAALPPASTAKPSQPKPTATPCSPTVLTLPLSART